MFSFTHLIQGFLMVVIGTLLLKYNFQVVNFTGSQDWIEAKLGGGSTYAVYKLVAVLLVVIGLLIMTGLGAPIADAVFSPLKDTFKGFSGK